MTVSLLSAEPDAPYERPPLSKETITAPDEPSPRVIATATQLSDLGIRYHPGLIARQLDLTGGRVHLRDGDALSFDRLLLATGAQPRLLPDMPHAEPRIRTLRTYNDAIAIRKLASAGSRALIIGGGFIGLEVAAGCRQKGCNVEILEAAPRLLGRVLPDEIADAVAKRHLDEGVLIRLGTGVSRLQARDDIVVVDFTDGRAVEVDFVVVGIGVEPDVSLAAQAGLKIENGIAVNSALETEVEGVFAAGDCCSFPIPFYGGKRARLETWRNAQKQGEHAAGNMLGGAAAFDAVPWFWSDQYNMTLHVAGLPKEGEETIVRSLDDVGRVWFHLGPDGRLLAASGLGIGSAVAKEVRLAEILMTRGRSPSRAQLQDAGVSLKSLLAG